jgi:signal transduction histidine kinase
VAHEINNPLAYVVAALQFLERELEELGGGLPRERVEDARRALADAREGARRVTDVVRGLKTFSRSDEERVGPVDVHPVLESSINLAWNELKHRARLVRDLGETPPVAANESRLGQVFLNLLINAAQAIPEGRVDVNEIRVRTRTDAAGRAVVEVSDTGQGIAPDVARHVFDPFFTTKPIGQGTGLGLDIVRRLVRHNEGDIDVESRPGRTEFRVSLPIADDAGSS